jgi:hypothetical protein
MGKTSHGVFAIVTGQKEGLLFMPKYSSLIIQRTLTKDE